RQSRLLPATFSNESSFRIATVPPRSCATLAVLPVGGPESFRFLNCLAPMLARLRSRPSRAVTLSPFLHATSAQSFRPVTERTKETRRPRKGESTGWCHRGKPRPATWKTLLTTRYRLRRPGDPRDWRVVEANIDHAPTKKPGAENRRTKCLLPELESPP